MAIALTLLVGELDVTVYGDSALGGSAAGLGLNATGDMLMVFSYLLTIMLLGSDEDSGLQVMLDRWSGMLGLPTGNGIRRNSSSTYKNSNANLTHSSTANANAPPSSSSLSSSPMHDQKFEAKTAVLKQQPDYSASSSLASTPLNQSMNALPTTSSSAAAASNSSLNNMRNPSNSSATAAPFLPVINSSPQKRAAAANDYICKAMAIYAYDANPEDPHEISFKKGDLLEITDNKVIEIVGSFLSLNPC